jgi:hypothetical protein
MTVSAADRMSVRRRADERCEYCRLAQSELALVAFQIEHVIARQHGGSDDQSNSCLACHWCNLHKGPNIASLDGAQLVPLFNPRTQVWSEHFMCQGERIIGLTSVGRVTVQLLNMNDPDRLELRRFL